MENSDDHSESVAPVDVDATPPARSLRAGDLARRIARVVGWTSIVAGLLILGFVVHQLFITDWLAKRHQGELETRIQERFEEHETEAVPVNPESTSLDDLVTAVTSPTVTTVPPGTYIDPQGDSLVYYREAAPETGEAFGVIRVPGLSLRSGGPLEWAFVEGTSLDLLKNGAGHMPDTAVPGQLGNAVISGHRTTWGAPFHNLDQLSEGDRIEVETAIGTHVFAVDELRVVRPHELWVTEQPGDSSGYWGDREGAWLTLTTCNPKFSARERLIVFAELVEGPNAEVIQRLSSVDL